MKKIFLVIGREYTTRIKKISFWVLAVMVPLLIGALYAVPVWMSERDAERVTVMVVDETGLFQSRFASSEEVKYKDAGNLEYARKAMREGDGKVYVLYVPARETTIPQDAFLYYEGDEPSAGVSRQVDNQLQVVMRDAMLLDVHGISADDYYQMTHTAIRLRVKDVETGREGLLKVKRVVGMVMAVLVCLIILLLGSQVMRGVVEEKNNRIVEILLSSVRPFELMLGKLVGIALVGVTQFVVWVILSFLIVGGVRNHYSDFFSAIEQRSIQQLATKGEEATLQYEALQERGVSDELVEAMAGIDYSVLIGFFALYFLLGYLLYAALFASVGALVDEGTMHQFVLPLMAPLLLSLLALPQLLGAPSGMLSVWLSVIPFTSPVAMLVRIPFGVSIWQFVLSVVLLLAALVGMVWAASRIYCRNILRFR